MEIENVIKQGIKLNILGELSKIPKQTRKTLKKAFSLLKNKKIVVNLAINYGSKNEIIQSFKK